VPGQLLIIHDSGLMRQILTKYALTELAEMQLHSVASAREGLAVLQARPVDVVIAAMEMGGLDGPAFQEQMKRLPGHQDTPLIVVTSTKTMARLRQLAERGVRHILVVPFTAVELRQAVEQAIDWRAQRASERYSFLDSQAVISSGQERLAARVINLSLGGVLCQVEVAGQRLDFLQPVRLDLTFPPEYGAVQAQGIKAALVRLTVAGWSEAGQAQVVRAAWRFLEIPKAAAVILAQALASAAADLNQAQTQAARELEA
jgi:CheY-like chemotaxis protein